MKRILFAMLCIVSALGMRAQNWTGSEPAEGDFYLYNVGAGKFLNAGDRAAQWGTNACLSVNYGLDFTLEANGTDYNLNSKNSNGGANNYLATSLWTDGGATPWTFTSAGDKVYTISNGGNFLAATSAGDDVELVSSGDGANAQWILVSRENVIAAMASATKDSPMNISFLLGAPDFNRNDTRAQNGKSWAWTNNGGNVTVAGPNAQRGTFGCEFWNNTFDINQTLTDMPDGTYEFKIAGYGTNGTTYIYGNTTEVVFANQTSAANFATALDNIADGQFAGNTTGRFNLIGGTLKVGVKRATNKSADWAVFDNAELIYYGLDLSEFESALAAAVAAAEAVEGTVPTAAYDVLAGVVAEQNKTYTTAADYTAATDAIVAATNTAKSLQANYARYQAVKAAVLAINSGINVSEADAQADAATDDAGIDTAVATVRQALANYLSTVTLSQGQTIDLTAALIDNPAPGMSGNTEYWTNSGNPGLQFNLWEYYQVSGGTTKQTIATSLPAGNYKLTAIAFTRTGYEAKLNAGENSTNIAQVASGTVNNREQGNNWIAEGNGNGVTDLVFNLSEATAGLEIGLTASNNGDKWMCWRSFSLVYGDVFEPYSLVEGKMNAEVAATQTAADAAFKATPSPTNYQAVIEAIASAQASVNAYAAANAAVEKANAIKEAHNFATAEATTTFENAISQIWTAYEAGTLSDGDANNAGTTLGVSVSGWHANANGAAVNYMENGFGLNDFDAALYINTWSTEGESDGSNFKVPFYEYFAGDGTSLDAKTWTASLNNLENGLYEVSVWARVRTKNDETAAADAIGISMNVNGGTNVDITEGEQIGTSRFQLKEYTAQGLVKDGILNLNLEIIAENNIHWLSFKNIKYTKVRDLTPEEMAVIPTAIALNQTEVELTATDNTVTLTPTFTPEDATETVTWTTSDENVATVANGVVTAVAPGTATITVTSTLDATVTASATVTVVFPESTVPATIEYAEGPALTVYTLSQNNLLKNGTFGYPNAVATWKTVGYTTDAIASNFVITAEGGAVDGGAFITTNAGGAGAVTTLRKSVPVEVGKKYYFSVYTSGKAPASNNFQYNALFKMSDAVTESGTLKEFEWPQGANNETTEWSKTEFVFTAETPYVGVRMGWNSSTSFDEFVLVEVTDEQTIGNVQYALDAIPTANIGTGAFQYSQDAVDAANALVQGTATVAEVEAAYAALTTINAPADGQLFYVVLTYDGYEYDNKAMTFIANGRTDGGLYNIQYKEVANQNLAQAFTFTKVEGNNYKMSQIDADGVARYISTGVPYSGNTSQIRTTTNADQALVVTVIPTATEGKWNLRNTEANQYIGSQDAGVYTVNSHIDFVLVETQKPSITINTTAAGWGTTMLPFAAEKPADVKVYTCAELSGEQLTLVEVDALEANKPYIIEGAWNETLTGDAQGTALTYVEGVLTGVYAKTAAPTGSYVMQKLNDKVGFYKVSEEKPINVPANRAYVTVAGSEVKAFYLDGATGINGVFDALQNGDIYDLTGRKVQRMQKGNVYIVNGKKVVVK